MCVHMNFLINASRGSVLPQAAHRYIHIAAHAQTAGPIKSCFRRACIVSFSHLHYLCSLIHNFKYLQFSIFKYLQFSSTFQVPQFQETYNILLYTLIFTAYSLERNSRNTQDEVNESYPHVEVLQGRDGRDGRDGGKGRREKGVPRGKGGKQVLRGQRETKERQDQREVMDCLVFEDHLEFLVLWGQWVTRVVVGPLVCMEHRDHQQQKYM